MRQRDLIVNPTLACGNPLNFKEDLDILEKTGIKILHIDIMDIVKENVDIESVYREVYGDGS